MTLSTDQLTVSFTAPDGGRLAALGPISFEMATGSFVCLLGPSGCGKSTLVRVFAGLQPPTSGAAYLDGTPISAPSPRAAMMFQDANLMPWRTVIENITLPLELAGIRAPEREHRAEKLLATLGLADFARAYPGALSGGMKQRAALGRVLIQSPDVLLLDEPFGALDALTRETISLDLLRVWSQHGPTVLMVTHDIHEAVLLADRVIVLSRRPGRITADVLVPLPRPRHPEMVYTADFGATARRLREAIDRA